MKINIPSPNEKEITTFKHKNMYDVLAFTTCKDINRASENASSAREWSIATWDNPDKHSMNKEPTAGKNDEEKNDYTTSGSDSFSEIFTEGGFSDLTYETSERDLQNERPKKISYGQRSTSDGNEKFDLFSATEGLRLYSNKLKSEKKKAKEKERVATLHRLGRSPSATQRYEELYNMRKSRIIPEKDNSKAPEIKIEKRTGTHSPASEEVMKRLYDRSIPMQNFGKDRRKEISKMRALSNTRNRIKVNFSPTPGTLTVPSTTFSPKLRNSSPSPTPEEVMERLYGRSLRMKEVGKERRKEIDKMRAQSNPRKPPTVTRSLSSPTIVSRPSSSRKLLSSPCRNIGVKLPTLHSVTTLSTPEEVIGRLYNRSHQMQERGKERREEVRERSICAKV